MKCRRIKRNVFSCGNVTVTLDLKNRNLTEVTEESRKTTQLHTDFSSNNLKRFKGELSISEHKLSVKRDGFFGRKFSLSGPNTNDSEFRVRASNSVFVTSSIQLYLSLDNMDRYVEVKGDITQSEIGKILCILIYCYYFGYLKPD